MKRNWQNTYQERATHRIPQPFSGGRRGRSGGACRKMPGDIRDRSHYIPDQVEDKLDTGKAIFQIAAVEIAVDHLFDIGPSEAVLT